MRTELCSPQNSHFVDHQASYLSRGQRWNFSTKSI